MSRTLPRPIRGRGRSLASMGFIDETFESGLSPRGRERGKKRTRENSLRQRNEFVLIGNGCEAAALPVRFRLFDPLFTGRDEIPPDVARAFQRVAAEEHHPRGP